ncbi:acetyl-CoA carboxylase biotin carboxyl carrier protein subunit [Anaerovorax odorimutans]|uniref:Acetyl-CoA carboxylase biotin carboxyl carrier protein subunit n=1 Tax=Anaerovorax odorimutans TaxID=109327 RepID=A0ABT1RPJ8_9FIRM|nr:acetyl-CoA carboxylase biotin carboxyl carrier protein subunit [Anaerovorax odorimutans]MCQ4637117.1 acetyl-CoA carboxylase biotin carboxyl carrier protein subunit [Anaerovorax odorimutans]
MGYRITAPLPGSIWEVKVKEGDQIKENQVVIILEAMKMENEIPADFDGTVKKIYVEKGQTVKTGELLAEVD